MKELDLHGLSHDRIKDIVSSWVHENPPPVEIGDEYFNNGPVSDEEIEAGRAVIMSLVYAMQLEQSRARLYFTLIPLAFSVGLLLGYYISYVNL